ncbi:MAG: alpha/beta hydrolase [Opitutaceae bacterium]|nr:alpha/beta hydrolase [Opitutaceae bacterium]
MEPRIIYVDRMLVRLSVLCSAFFMMTLSAAPAPETFILWPKGAPEPVGFVARRESTSASPRDNLRRVTDVSVPTLTLYRPAKPNGTAILVFPGGAYNQLAFDHEGVQVCEWLNSIGVTAGLVKYRVPRRDPDHPEKWPLQDAQRAMGWMRHNAAAWGFRPDHVGALGFSAGGHLIIELALNPQPRTYTSDNALDVDDVIPDFLLPIYPAYLVTAQDTFHLKPGLKVTEQAPPIFLVHANNDSGATSSSASALLYLEYKRANRPAELHIFADGGHGFGMHKSGLPSADWPARAEAWLRQKGWLTPPHR